MRLLNEKDNHREQRMNRRTVLRTGAVAVGGLALGGAGTASADSKPQKFTQDISGICIKPAVTCLDETVCSVDPSEQIWTVHTTSDGNGGVHVNTHSYRTVNIEGQESDTKWSGTGTKSFNKTVRGRFPQTVHFNNRLVATSKGSTTNLEITTTFQTTINANGEVTAYKLDNNLGCKGGNR